MWPFARKRASSIDEAVAGAVEFAAERWAIFCETSGMPANINLRDRVAYFAGDFGSGMTRAFPALRNAPEELVLLIIAEGIEVSGRESRRMIELQLGIVLPDRMKTAAS